MTDHIPTDPRGYRCIVADPPWKVAAGRSIGEYVRAADGSQPFGVRDNAARPLLYPSMTVEQIAGLKPPAADLLAACKASLALGRKIYHNANAHEAPMDWAHVRKLLEIAIAKAEGRV